MYYNRIKATTATTGTGTYTVGTAANGFKTFSALANGTLVPYTVEYETGDWEIGIGTKNGSTIERTTLLESSTGSFISWPSGNKTIFCDIPAQKITVTAGASNIPLANTSGKIDYSYLDAQVSGPEITAGTETATRRMSPADVVDLIDTHGSGGGITLPINQSDVTGLVSDLASKAELPIAQSDVTGLVTALSDLNIEVDGKAETIHASQHQHGGSDPVGTATPGANAIIKADSDGKIGSGWIDPADVVAHYNSLVAQVSGGEITAGTETNIRRYSPADIVALIAAHETGGGGSSWTYTDFNYAGFGTGSVSTPLLPVDNEHLLVSSTSDANVYIGTIASPTEGMSFRVTKISANGRIQVGTTGTLAEADRTSLASVADSVEYRYLDSKWYAFNLRQTALTAVVVSSGTTYSQTRGTNAIIRSNNNITVSLPSTPMQYQRQRVTKDTGTMYLVTIDLNGETLYNASTTLYLDSQDTFIELVFINGYWYIAVDGRAVRVSSTERNNGTVIYPRVFSPSDVKSMITTHASGGGLTPTSVKTANYTAVAGEMVWVDGSAATADIIITLPATAADCGVLLVGAMNRGWSCRIARNGNTVNGSTDMTDLASHFAGETRIFRRLGSGAYSGEMSPLATRIGAYNFDGTAYYSIANNAALNLTTALSMSMWIRKSALATASYIFCNGVPLTSGFTLGFASSSNQPNFNDGTGWRICSSSIPNNEWCHLVVAWGASAVSWYINGVLINSPTASASSTAFTGTKYFGSQDASTNLSTAFIWNFQLFGYKLTQANVTSLFADKLPYFSQELGTAPILWFRGEETKTTAIDRSATGANGTQGGTVLTVAAPRQLTMGAIRT